MGKKLTYEFVKEQFEKEGYELLDAVYVNSRTKLKYICSHGHEHSISWDSWKQGHKCPYCANVGRSTIEFIKSEFEKENYRLLTNKYINNRQKLKYICPKGHKHVVTWLQWYNRKFRCPYCSKKAKPDINYIYKVFKIEGYELLSTIYINNRHKLRCVCPNNHKYNVNWRDWQIGGRCPICRNEKMSINRMGNKNPNWKGGISCEPYCDIWLDKEYKESIKERDGYRCLNPDCWGTLHRLDIHHINYNKKNCGPENLITLCRSCNSRANKDREWHTSWYQVIMYRRYGYNYEKTFSFAC